MFERRVDNSVVGGFPVEDSGDIRTAWKRSEDVSGEDESRDSTARRITTMLKSS
jgi:hypothetical protein